MIAHNQVVKFQIAKKSLNFIALLISCIWLLFFVCGDGRMKDWWTQSISRCFFHHQCSGNCHHQQ